MRGGLLICVFHVVLGSLGNLGHPMWALASWTRPSGKRKSWVEPHVRGCKCQKPVNHIQSGYWLGCLWPLLSTSYMTLLLKRALGCPTEGGNGSEWVPVALPSREPCKELGLGFPSGNLSSWTSSVFLQCHGNCIHIGPLRPQAFPNRHTTSLGMARGSRNQDQDMTLGLTHSHLLVLLAL